MSLDTLLNTLLSWVPSIVIVMIAVVVIGIYRKLILNPSNGEVGDNRWSRQLILMLIVIGFLIALLLAMPISEGMKGQLFNLLGIALTATIALSSTTFVGNTMAGFMLMAIDSIRPGDFLKVGDHVGRVSEQGLLYTEIQTEDRDLTTLPNLYLVTTPVTVVRTSGTIISATISLGYDVPRKKIEEVLIGAGEAVGLSEPYVQILDLGDYSVTYRIAGFLQDVKYLISFRSKLRGGVLDALHEAGIEIVSPSFMNQRVFPQDKVFIPRKLKTSNHDDEQRAPEDLIFDKAEEAYSKEKIKEMVQINSEKIAVLEELKKEEHGVDHEAQLLKLHKRKEYLEKMLAERMKEKE